MLKAPAQGSVTRDRILDAAFESLRLDGFARSSARSIAARGAFNQALIFYHFGSVTGAFLAALDRISSRRMARYQEMLAVTTDLRQLVATARMLYEEDIDSGHSTVLAELFAASAADPDLRDRMLERIRPWLDFTEDLIRRHAAGMGLAGLVDERAAATAMLALYLGTDLLTHLEQDRSRAVAMFDAGERLVALAAGLLPSGPSGLGS